MKAANYLERSHFVAVMAVKNRQNISLTRFKDFSTMAAFSLPKFVFISAAAQGKVSREKGGVGRTSSS